MFPREERLRGRSDIDRILKTGRRVSGPTMMLRYLPNRRIRPRVTVVVGTVVSKRAVMRNRLKRQLRHILVAELKGLKIGADLMLSTRPAALKQTRPARLAEVHTLLRRAGIV